MTETISEPAPGCDGFALGGDLTIQCAAERAAELLEKLGARFTPHAERPATAPAAAPHELRLDLSGLADIDSAGVQILVAARHLCARHGRRLRLAPCSRTVQAALALFQLDDTLQAAPQAADRREGALHA